MDMPTGNKSTVNFDFHGRTALVTGAGRGVGEEIARLFHASGARVAVSDIDGQAARQLADRLDDSGVSAMALTLDVRSKRAFEDARDRIASAWGRTDIVVNNAGYAKRTPVQDITTEEFDDIVAINMRSVFLSCQVFADHMRSNGWGRIVNITSLAGQNGGTVASAQARGHRRHRQRHRAGPDLHGQGAAVAGTDRAHREAGADRPIRRSLRVRRRGGATGVRPGRVLRRGDSGHERRALHALRKAGYRSRLTPDS